MMQGQIDIFENDDSIDERFHHFDKENPTVYVLFKQFATQAAISGLKRYGAKAIFELIRWQINIETKNSKFKINNSYVSRYVRKLICECPEFTNFFETRILKG